MKRAFLAGLIAGVLGWRVVSALQSLRTRHSSHQGDAVSQYDDEVLVYDETAVKRYSSVALEGR